MGDYSNAVYPPGRPGQPPVNMAVRPGNQSTEASEHGVDMRGTTDTTGEVENRASTNYDREHDDFWGKITSFIFKDDNVQGQVQDETSRDAEILAQGVTTRSAPGMPNTHYMSYDHEALQKMVKDGVSPGMSQDISDSWIRLGNGMVEHQELFVNAITASQSEWRGKSGDNARQFMADVANYIGKAGQSAQLAGKQESLHSQALSSAGNSMPEPIPFNVDAANADLKNTTNPFEYIKKYTGYMATYQASQKAHQEAADVLTGYDTNLSGASTMPAFDKPPQMAGSASPRKPGGTDDPGGTGGTGGTGGSGGSGSIGGGGGSGGAGSGGGGGGTGPVIPGGLPGGGGSGGGSGGGGIGGGGTGPGVPGGGVPGGGGGPGRTPGQSFDPGLSGGGGGGGSGFNNPNYAGAGGMPMGPMGGGFVGGGDETRGGSRAGGGGFGTGAGGGAGGRGGAAGVGGLAAEQAAMGGRGGAAGARGAAGMGGMGGLGAGRGQGGEDEEHERPSYLVEPDPDSTFGTDEMTAPPVIGG